MKPRVAETIPLQGSDVDFLEPSLPKAIRDEISWAWRSLSRASKARSLVLFYKGRCIAHCGKGPSAENLTAPYSPAAAKYGPICAAVMKQDQANYLANLMPYPGRLEFYPYLPGNTQAVIVHPVGKDGVAVLAADAIRGFAPLDQAWIGAVSDKLAATLEEAGWFPKGAGFKAA
jgi:hypothetical protein